MKSWTQASIINVSMSEDGSFAEKIKAKIFRKTSNKIQGGGGTSTSKPSPREIIFTHEILKEIGPESPANHRLRTIRELGDIVQNKKLEDNAVEVLWMTIRDLIQSNKTTDSRQTAFNFLHSLIQGQLQSLGPLRHHFLLVIKNHAILEDLNWKLEIFKCLTESGKDLTYLEEEIGDFLLLLMSDVIQDGKHVLNFLNLLLNTIKYNAAYLDEEVVVELIRQTCVICAGTQSEDQLEMCIRVLDTVVCYSYLPSEGLYAFIECLCRTVNIEKFCQTSWMLMRKLLGTHLGHSGIFTMCKIMQDKEKHKDYTVVRGAVFFVGMALWGSRKLTNVKHTPGSVLPSFLKALGCNNSVVAYEVVLSLQRLVKKYGKEIQLLTWDTVLEILELLLEHVEVVPSKDKSLANNLHDIFTTVETLYELGQFNGSTSHFFSIIEKCTNSRSENSVLVLIQYHAQNIHPSRSDWIQNLFQLMEKYFRSEMRTAIRLKTLDLLSAVLSTNRHAHETDLIELVVLPQLSRIEADPDIDVRDATVQLLVDLIQGCNSHRCDELLVCLEKLIKRAMVLSTSSSPVAPNKDAVDLTHVQDESNLRDIHTAVTGLVAVFRTKLYKLPSIHACKVYELLCSHIKTHYTHGYLSRISVDIRLAVIRCFLELRADSSERVGLPDLHNNSKIRYSPYVYCAHRHSDDFSRSPRPSPRESPNIMTEGFMTLHASVVPFSETFSIYLNCLENEKDWDVLEILLEQLTHQLQNKTLILSAGSEIEALCSKICSMVSDRSLDPSKAYLDTPAKFTRSDYHGYLFPVLTALATYSNILTKNQQRELIRCLEFGLVSKCAKSCVTTLTVCMLEMTDSMMRQMPPLLGRLAQITATIAMATPMLEFLSNLIHVPKLYTNFVEDQYKSILAIALPYTNPFKYNHYTVSLAHHVIAMWFLKCRLPFRKDLVKFINKGLQNNVLRQFQESKSKSMTGGEDTTELHRSGSHSESMMKRPSRPHSLSVEKIPEDPTITDNEPTLQFHKELTETCIDTMARYTFSNCSANPSRSPLTEFLLSGGQSQMWLVGNKLVTITTSGSGNQSGKSSLCEKCLALCRHDNDSNNDEVFGNNGATLQNESFKSKKRHKSAAVISKSSVDVEPLRPRSSIDDIELHRQASVEETRCDLDHDTDHTDNILQLGLKKQDSSSAHICPCWCQGWAEISIQRPSGKVAWMMRFENDQLQTTSGIDFPLADISTLFLPSFNGDDDSIMGIIDSEQLGELEYDSIHEEYFPSMSSDTSAIDIPVLLEPKPQDEDAEKIGGKKSGHSPIRRYNSSPDLASSPEKATKESSFNLQHQALRNSFELKKLSDSGSDIYSNKDDRMVQDIPQVKIEGTDDKKPAAVQSLSEKQKPEKPKLVSQLSVDSASLSMTSSTEEDGTVVYRRKPRGYTLPSIPSAPVLKPAKDSGKGGFNPNFVFLQLYHSPYMNDKDKPVLLPQDDMMIQRGLRNLDRIPCYETHKIGVVYVGPGQAGNEMKILSNKYGSSRYMEFLQGLGQLIKLDMIDQSNVFLGGLDTQGSDGKFAYCWHDDITQVIFHVATLMPNKSSDVNCNAKKLHIGNDFVSIIYNESNEKYTPETIKCQFNYVNIVIQPLDNESNAVTVKVKEELCTMIDGSDTKIISDKSLAILVRQMALHANLASLILQRQQSNPKDPYASNWLERLRQIKRIHSKVIENEKDNSSSSDTVLRRQLSSRISGVEDFTSYV